MIAFHVGDWSKAFVSLEIVFAERDYTETIRHRELMILFISSSGPSMCRGVLLVTAPCPHYGPKHR